MASFIAEGVWMDKNPIGLFFTADGCGDRRFTSKSAAMEAYRAHCAAYWKRNDEQRAARPNRYVYRSKESAVYAIVDHAIVGVYPARNVDDARRRMNSDERADFWLIQE